MAGEYLSFNFFLSPLVVCFYVEIFWCYLLSLSFALASKMQRYNSFKHTELTFQVAASLITTELPLDSKYLRKKIEWRLRQIGRCSESESFLMMADISDSGRICAILLLGYFKY